MNRSGLSLRNKFEKARIPWPSKTIDTLEKAREDKTYVVEQGEFAPLLFVCFFVIVIFGAALSMYRFSGMDAGYNYQMDQVRQIKSENEESDDEVSEVASSADYEVVDEFDKRTHTQTLPDAAMLPDMQTLYEQNKDVIGWIKIPDTNVDYPIMQTMDDENYYLDKDINGNYSANGCIILDTDSTMGSGTKEKNYADGTLPSTNLIIHGHNMKNGSMFGNLDKFRDQSYEMNHNTIEIQSLTEHRKYEIVAVFLSQVYLKSQKDVFKYYKFFEAYNEKQFNDFYENIKELSLYDTGVTAEYGDEFITLSVCAYHVENGRLAIVAKRVQ